ncbi:hypothetical protein BN126310130 [Stenotrophomonas maltophilia]|nr:hypothetical protein BN126310130 [Stenotrophomonas maltophilia]
MSTERIAIHLQARPDRSISIAERHLHVMDRMSAIECPLGFHGLELPPVHDCGEELLASYEIKTGLKGLSIIGTGGLGASTRMWLRWTRSFCMGSEAATRHWTIRAFRGTASLLLPRRSVRTE